MSYNSKEIPKDVKGMPGPSYYNPDSDEYEIYQGANGGAYFFQRGTVAQEAWNDTAPITTFPSNRYGFFITNDGTANLTFTINGYTRTVKPGEKYQSCFDAFTSLTISATGAYRGEVYK
jgi:hypothetical protein